MVVILLQMEVPHPKKNNFDVIITSRNPNHRHKGFLTQKIRTGDGGSNPPWSIWTCSIVV